jgi:hypothetical protein
MTSRAARFCAIRGLLRFHVSRRPDWDGSTFIAKTLWALGAFDWLGLRDRLIAATTARKAAAAHANAGVLKNAR